jgi:hypothetical protein
MAGQYTDWQMSYRIMDADGVEQYTGVVLTGNGECKKPTADNMVPLGVVDNDQRINDPLRAGGDQTTRQVAVKLEGIAAIKIFGAVAVGDRIILKTGGHGMKIPATAGQYNVLGFAEVPGVDGDVIPVRMAYHSFTI